MECATQRSELTHVAGFYLQHFNCGQPCLNHFTRFFQENVAQFIFFEVSVAGCRRWRGGCFGHTHRGGQLIECGHSFTSGLGQRRLVSQHRLRSDVVQLAGNATVGQAFLR